MSSNLHPVSNTPFFIFHNRIIMPKTTRILVVDSDLHTLSKIYLSLIHKNYKVEATDDAQEIIPRIDRFKPRMIILNTAAKNLTVEVYAQLAQKRIQALLIHDAETGLPVESNRWEIVKMPADVAFFDNKIRETLAIVD